MCSRVNESKLERWLGPTQMDDLYHHMETWYGDPIVVGGVPGRVLVGPNGFYGNMTGGRFASFLDYNEERSKKIKDALRKMSKNQQSTLNMAGFAGLTEFLQAFKTRNTTFAFSKIGLTATAAGANSLWAIGGSPIAGGYGSLAPSGTSYTSADTGAMYYTNPSGTDRTYIAGAYASKSTTAVHSQLLLYDRLFSVAKTMSSSATQAVTGTPSRYQNTSSNQEDSITNNFLTVEVSSTLSNTAHNWTVCTYTSDNGTTGKTVPSFAGINTLAQHRIDIAIGRWFAPLAVGDRGIKNLTQMQCDSAALTGGISFTIGHPLIWLPFYDVFQIMLDGLIGSFHLVRVQDNACLTFLEPMRQTTANSYRGYINMLTM